MGLEEGENINCGLIIIFSKPDSLEIGPEGCLSSSMDVDLFVASHDQGPDCLHVDHGSDPNSSAFPLNGLSNKGKKRGIGRVKNIQPN